MNPFNKTLIPLALTLALASTPVLAQNSKQALAARLVQLQVQMDGEALTEQLAVTAIGPLVAKWSQRVQESVPADKQQDVTRRLDAELEKLGDGTEQAIRSQLQAAAEAALVPLYMQRLSEDEMKAVIAYLESPASEKFQSLSVETTEAWAQKIVSSTEAQVKTKVDAFEAAAIGIVGVSGRQ